MNLDSKFFECEDGFIINIDNIISITPHAKNNIIVNIVGNIRYPLEGDDAEALLHMLKPKTRTTKELIYGKRITSGD